MTEDINQNPEQLARDRIDAMLREAVRAINPKGNPICPFPILTLNLENEK